MSNTYFRFKQFTIQQDKTAMKVNTDGVLLGAWADIRNAVRIADVGTGTGVIALMFAQRQLKAMIDAIEIDKASAEQARENVRQSTWHQRIHVIHDDFRHFALQHGRQYDTIVSNPPYFINSLLSSESTRAVARHAGQLPHKALIESSLLALLPEGRLHVILPYVEGTIFIAEAAAKGLYCVRKTTVHSADNKPPKRLLLSFSQQAETLHEKTLYIHPSESAAYTPEYKVLTCDFYLNF
jgi:tRNA1Val (adenine37-N6)-methyltransferase